MWAVKSESQCIFLVSRDGRFLPSGCCIFKELTWISYSEVKSLWRSVTNGNNTCCWYVKEHSKVLMDLNSHSRNNLEEGIVVLFYNHRNGSEWLTDLPKITGLVGRIFWSLTWQLFLVTGQGCPLASRTLPPLLRSYLGRHLPTRSVVNHLRSCAEHLMKGCRSALEYQEKDT